MRPILLCFAFVCLHASAQIVVRVNGAPPVRIESMDLEKMPHHAAMLNDHGKQIAYEGVLLHDVLAKAGVDFGKGLRGKQLSTYVAALASDGYQVVFSLADFDPTIVDSGIIVADKRKDKALDTKEGPLRIIVPHDQRPARSLKMLQEIDIVQLKK